MEILPMSSLNHRHMAYLGLAAIAALGAPIGSFAGPKQKANFKAPKGSSSLEIGVNTGGTVVCSEPLIGKNSVCHCGSGKKFKKCCRGKLREVSLKDDKK